MPIHELGYRSWEGRLLPRWRRSWSISRTGVKLALRLRVLRRLMLLSIAPLLYLAPGFFVIGVMTDPTNPGGAPALQSMFGWVFEDPEIRRQLMRSPELVRGPLWNDIFHNLFTYFGIWGGIVSTIFVAPSLLSRDLRSKAFLLYFSKPITRVDYILGKAGVIMAFLLWFTLLPCLLIYLTSIAFSPTSATFMQTIGVVPRIVAASLVYAIPTAALALFVSSTTKDERVAMFTWLAILVGGWIIYGMLSSMPGVRHSDWVTLVCLPQTIRVAFEAIFTDPVLATTPRDGPSGLALGWLAFLTIGSLAGVWNKVSAPFRA